MHLYIILRRVFPLEWNLESSSIQDSKIYLLTAFIKRRQEYVQSKDKDLMFNVWRSRRTKQHALEGERPFVDNKIIN